MKIKYVLQSRNTERKNLYISSEIPIHVGNVDKLPTCTNVELSLKYDTLSDALSFKSDKLHKYPELIKFYVKRVISDEGGWKCENIV